MAEPGDPPPFDPAAPRPTDPAVDHDDLIGFSSAAALQGRARDVPKPAPEPDPEPLPAMSAEPTAPVVTVTGSDREPEPVVTPEPDLFEPTEPAAAAVPRPPREPEPALPYAASPSLAPAKAPPPTPAADTPGWAVETPVVPGAGRSARTVAPPPEVANSTGLYAVYALILFAVPTLGVSALIALLAVTARPGPSGAVAASHFVFQQRTLWASAVVALLGAILIAVGLGVFVLFLVAVWLILRGASGVLALKAGRAVRDPRGWFLA